MMQLDFSCPNTLGPRGVRIGITEHLRKMYCDCVVLMRGHDLQSFHVCTCDY